MKQLSCYEPPKHQVPPQKLSRPGVVLPGICVLMQEMVNKDSNRIRLPKYVCRDLSPAATVHADKIKGVNFRCSRVHYQVRSRNRKQDFHFHCVFQKYNRAGSVKGGSWLVALVYVTSVIIENVRTAVGGLSRPPLKISVICDFISCGREELLSCLPRRSTSVCRLLRTILCTENCCCQVIFDYLFLF